MMYESLIPTLNFLNNFALTCSKSGGLLGFPTWYKYLDGTVISQQIKDGKSVQICQPMLRSIADIWLIVAAVIEMLLRVGTLISIGFIVWGGIQLITSQGEPGSVKSARETIQNAIIGLVITILATVFVGFIAGNFNAA